MLYHLHTTQQLNCDITTAWDFFSTPRNLSLITPKEMKFTILSELTDQGIYEGMLIQYKVSPFLHIPLNWCTEIQQVNYQKNFIDFQKKGPYKLWKHFHEFIPNDKGVLMKDTVEYSLPLGVIGKLGHAVFIRKKINYIFSYRYHVLEKLFNSQNPFECIY